MLKWQAKIDERDVQLTDRDLRRAAGAGVVPILQSASDWERLSNGRSTAVKEIARRWNASAETGWMQPNAETLRQLYYERRHGPNNHTILCHQCQNSAQPFVPEHFVCVGRDEHGNERWECGPCHRWHQAAIQAARRSGVAHRRLWFQVSRGLCSPLPLPRDKTVRFVSMTAATNASDPPAAGDLCPPTPSL